MKKHSLLLLVFALGACTAQKIPSDMVLKNAPVVVYKTRADYRNLVPVTLDAGRERVVSYPAPGDLNYRGEPALPLKLKKGYLLDRRGIGPNSAFTSYTYLEYSGLLAAPSPGILLEQVVDSDPFLEMYECSEALKYKDLDAEISSLIDAGFAGCRKLK
ncbi:MAG: hypothetical protein R2751_08635 [Bacteroidales bacterium]